nr:hypothetical protein [Reticulibacter mediterranei]
MRQSISLTGPFATVDEILTGQADMSTNSRLQQLEHPRQGADDLLTRFGLTDAASRRWELSWQFTQASNF